MESILKKVVPATLAGAAVVTLWSSGDKSLNTNSEEKVAAVSLPPEDTLAKKRMEAFDTATYFSLSPNGQRVYRDALTYPDPYVIVDKDSAQMIIIDDHKKSIGKFPVILGKMKGENTNYANPADINPTDATTPAGEYEFGYDELDGKPFMVDGVKVFVLYGTDNSDGSIGIHPLPKKYEAGRRRALATPTPLDNRLSWGCINVDEKTMNTLKEYFPEESRGRIYILPDTPEPSIKE